MAQFSLESEYACHETQAYAETINHISTCRKPAGDERPWGSLCKMNRSSAFLDRQMKLYVMGMVAYIRSPIPRYRREPLRQWACFSSWKLSFSLATKGSCCIWAHISRTGRLWLRPCWLAVCVGSLGELASSH